MSDGGRIRLCLFIYGTLKRGYWNHQRYCSMRSLLSQLRSGAGSITSRQDFRRLKCAGLGQ